MTPAARQILNALEAAGEKGCTKGELAQAGGWSWLARVHELRRAGYDIPDRNREHFELVNHDVGRDSSQPGLSRRGEAFPLPPQAAVSPSTEPKLFEPPAPGHYGVDVAA